MTADVNVTEKVSEALRQNLRDATGDCVCDPAYTERDLVDPHCGWHEAEGTTDYDSVARVLAVLSDPEVLAGMAGVLLTHQDRDGMHDIYPTIPPVTGTCWCGWRTEPEHFSWRRQEQHRAHVATALADWLRGQG